MSNPLKDDLKKAREHICLAKDAILKLAIKSETPGDVRNKLIRIADAISIDIEELTRIKKML